MMSLSKRLVYCQFKYRSISIKLYLAVPEKELIMQNGMLQINVYIIYIINMYSIIIIISSWSYIIIAICLVL